MTRRRRSRSRQRVDTRQLQPFRRSFAFTPQGRERPKNEKSSHTTETSESRKPDQRRKSSREPVSENQKTLRGKTSMDKLDDPQQKAGSTRKQSPESVTVLGDSTRSSITSASVSKDSGVCPSNEMNSTEAVSSVHLDSTESEVHNAFDNSATLAKYTTDADLQTSETVDTNPVCELMKVCAISEAVAPANTRSLLPHQQPENVEIADILEEQPQRLEINKLSDLTAPSPKFIVSEAMPDVPEALPPHLEGKTAQRTADGAEPAEKNSSNVYSQSGASPTMDLSAAETAEEESQTLTEPMYQPEVFPVSEDDSEDDFPLPRLHTREATHSPYRPVLSPVSDASIDDPSQPEALDMSTTENIHSKPPTLSSQPVFPLFSETWSSSNVFMSHAAEEGPQTNVESACRYQPGVSPVSDSDDNDDQIHLSVPRMQGVTISPYRPVLSPVSDASDDGAVDVLVSAGIDQPQHQSYNTVQVKTPSTGAQDKLQSQVERLASPPNRHSRSSRDVQSGQNPEEGKDEVGADRPADAEECQSPRSDGTTDNCSSGDAIILDLSDTDIPLPGPEGDAGEDHPHEGTCQDRPKSGSTNNDISLAQARARRQGGDSAPSPRTDGFRHFSCRSAATLSYQRGRQELHRVHERRYSGSSSTGRVRRTYHSLSSSETPRRPVLDTTDRAGWRLFTSADRARRALNFTRSVSDCSLSSVSQARPTRKASTPKSLDFARSASDSSPNVISPPHSTAVSSTPKSLEFARSVSDSSPVAVSSACSTPKSSTPKSEDGVDCRLTRSGKPSRWDVRVKRGTSDPGATRSKKCDAAQHFQDVNKKPVANNTEQRKEQAPWKSRWDVVVKEPTPKLALPPEQSEIQEGLKPQCDSSAKESTAELNLPTVPQELAAQKFIPELAFPSDQSKVQEALKSHCDSPSKETAELDLPETQEAEPKETTTELDLPTVIQAALKSRWDSPTQEIAPEVDLPTDLQAALKSRWDSPSRETTPELDFPVKQSELQVHELHQVLGSLLDYPTEENLVDTLCGEQFNVQAAPELSDSPERDCNDKEIVGEIRFDALSSCTQEIEEEKKEALQQVAPDSEPVTDKLLNLSGSVRSENPQEEIEKITKRLLTLTHALQEPGKSPAASVVSSTFSTPEKLFSRSTLLFQSPPLSSLSYSTETDTFSATSPSERRRHRRDSDHHRDRRGSRDSSFSSPGSHERRPFVPQGRLRDRRSRDSSVSSLSSHDNRRPCLPRRQLDIRRPLPLRGRRVERGRLADRGRVAERGRLADRRAVASGGLPVSQRLFTFHRQPLTRQQVSARRPLLGRQAFAGQRLSTGRPLLGRHSLTQQPFARQSIRIRGEPLGRKPVLRGQPVGRRLFSLRREPLNSREPLDSGRDSGGQSLNRRVNILRNCAAGKRVVRRVVARARAQSARHRPSASDHTTTTTSQDRPSVYPGSVLETSRAFSAESCTEELIEEAVKRIHLLPGQSPGIPQKKRGLSDTEQTQQRKSGTATQSTPRPRPGSECSSKKSEGQLETPSKIRSPQQVSFDSSPHIRRVFIRKQRLKTPSDQDKEVSKVSPDKEQDLQNHPQTEHHSKTPSETEQESLKGSSAKAQEPRNHPEKEHNIQEVFVQWRSEGTPRCPFSNSPCMRTQGPEESSETHTDYLQDAVEPNTSNPTAELKDTDSDGSFSADPLSPEKICLSCCNLSTETRKVHLEGKRQDSVHPLEPVHIELSQAPFTPSSFDESVQKAVPAEENFTLEPLTLESAGGEDDTTQPESEIDHSSVVHSEETGSEDDQTNDKQDLPDPDPLTRLRTLSLQTSETPGTPHSTGLETSSTSVQKHQEPSTSLSIDCSDTAELPESQLLSPVKDYLQFATPLVLPSKSLSIHKDSPKRKPLQRSTSLSSQREELKALFSVKRKSPRSPGVQTKKTGTAIETLKPGACATVQRSYSVGASGSESSTQELSQQNHKAALQISYSEEEFTAIIDSVSACSQSIISLPEPVKKVADNSSEIVSDQTSVSGQISPAILLEGTTGKEQHMETETVGVNQAEGDKGTCASQRLPIEMQTDLSKSKDLQSVSRNEDHFIDDDTILREIDSCLDDSDPVIHNEVTAEKKPVKQVTGLQLKSEFMTPQTSTRTSGETVVVGKPKDPSGGASGVQQEPSAAEQSRKDPPSGDLKKKEAQGIIDLTSDDSPVTGLMVGDFQMQSTKQSFAKASSKSLVNYSGSSGSENVSSLTLPQDISLVPYDSSTSSEKDATQMQPAERSESCRKEPDKSLVDYSLSSKNESNTSLTDHQNASLVPCNLTFSNESDPSVFLLPAEAKLQKMPSDQLKLTPEKMKEFRNKLSRSAQFQRVTSTPRREKAEVAANIAPLNKSRETEIEILLNIDPDNMVDTARESQQEDIEIKHVDVNVTETGVEGGVQSEGITCSAEHIQKDDGFDVYTTSLSITLPKDHSVKLSFEPMNVEESAGSSVRTAQDKIFPLHEVTVKMREMVDPTSEQRIMTEEAGASAVQKGKPSTEISTRLFVDSVSSLNPEQVLHASEQIRTGNEASRSQLVERSLPAHLVSSTVEHLAQPEAEFVGVGLQKTSTELQLGLAEGQTHSRSSEIGPNATHSALGTPQPSTSTAVSETELGDLVPSGYVSQLEDIQIPEPDFSLDIEENHSLIGTESDADRASGREMPENEAMKETREGVGGKVKDSEQSDKTAQTLGDFSDREKAGNKMIPDEGRSETIESENSLDKQAVVGEGEKPVLEVPLIECSVVCERLDTMTQTLPFGKGDLPGSSLPLSPVEYEGNVDKPSLANVTHSSPVLEPHWERSSSRSKSSSIGRSLSLFPPPLEPEGQFPCVHAANTDALVHQAVTQPSSLNTGITAKDTGNSIVRPFTNSPGGGNIHTCSSSSTCSPSRLTTNIQCEESSTVEEGYVSSQKTNSAAKEQFSSQGDGDGGFRNSRDVGERKHSSLKLRLRKKSCPPEKNAVCKKSSLQALSSAQGETREESSTRMPVPVGTDNQMGHTRMDSSSSRSDGESDRRLHLSGDESSDDLDEAPAFLGSRRAHSSRPLVSSLSDSDTSSPEKTAEEGRGSADPVFCADPSGSQAGSSSQQPSAFSLDSLLRDKKETDALEEEMKVMQAELRAGILKGGIEALEKEENSDDEDENFTTEQRDVLSRLQMEDRQIADCHPGEQVLQAEQCGRLFTESISPAQCGFKNSRGSSLERLLDRLQPEFVTDILSSDIIPMTIRSLPSQEQVLCWLFLLASVHSDGLVVLKCGDQIQEVLQWQLEEVMGSGPVHHTWAPSIKDVFRLFVNWGAVPEDLLFDETVLGPKQIREVLPVPAEDVPPLQQPLKIYKRNVQSVLQILSACLQSRPAYSIQELTHLLLMVCRVALDSSLCDQSSLYELQVCTSSILECYSASQWHSSVPPLCRRLSTLTDHHHNQVHLTQLFPAASKRCLYLRQRLAYVMLFNALPRRLGDGSITDEGITNFQLKDVVCLVPRMRMFLETDLYRLSSLVYLLDTCVGSAFMLFTQQKQLYELIEAVRYMVSDMRDNVRRLDLIRVKDVLVRMCSKWDLALKSSNIRQRKIFACYSSQDSPAKMETLHASSQDDYSDDDDADVSSCSADEEDEETMEVESGEQSMPGTAGVPAWLKTGPPPDSAVLTRDGGDSATQVLRDDDYGHRVKRVKPDVEQSQRDHASSDEDSLPELYPTL